jgi:hypothetical protein
VLEASGVYSALAGGAAQHENTGVRFRDVAGRFFPGTARNVRRNLWACAEESDSRDVEKCADERIGLRKLLAQWLGPGGRAKE